MEHSLANYKIVFHLLFTRASCERKTENVCTVCDVMEMCVALFCVYMAYMAATRDC